MTYNINGINRAEPGRAHHREDLQRRHHQVGRPGDQGTQLRAPTLPATPIHVVFRSDQSGTTDNFQRYLDAASNGAWGKGTGQAFNGGIGEGAAGNEARRRP